MGNQFSFYGIHVHVVKLLDELGLTPDIEIVKARLPELGKQAVGLPKWKLQLLGRYSFARLAAKPPRYALLQDLHEGGGSACCWLADEQVDVIGHEHVTCQGKAVAVAHLAQNFDEQIFGVSRGKQGQPPVATARDEVQVAQSIAAVQSFRHGDGPEKPRP